MNLHPVTLLDHTIARNRGLSRPTLQDLENRFDGPIPAHLTRTETAHDLQVGHHRSLIRFSEGRVNDFTESLSKLETGMDFIGRDDWIDRARANIADHQAEIARHQEALAALEPVAMAAAAE